MMALALALTFSRGAWLAAAIGLLIMLAFRPDRISRALLGAAVAAGLALSLLLFLPTNGGIPIGQGIRARGLSLGSPTTGSMATRLHVWQDTLALVAARPLTGYGPDTFALVYPSFQTGNWTPGFLVDKAHADLLQVASTQGLLGVGTYLWMLLAFVLAFLKSRRDHSGVFGGFAAYQLQLQVNFSYLPAAAPYWLFAAAAVVAWTTRADQEGVPERSGRSRVIALAPVTLAVAGLIALAVILPYRADSKYRDALADKARNDPRAASLDLEEARRLAPQESLYAAEAGDVALRLRGDTIGPDPDWTTARVAYEDAVRLGTFLPPVFRHLAKVDEHLGLHDQALAVAKQAVMLDRFDPISQDLLTQLEQSPGG